MKRRTLLWACAWPVVRPRLAHATPVYDVVVVGSGLAGHCAALQAYEAGAKRVLILEKGPIAGGHSAYASGSIAFVDAKRQGAQGIVDSVEQFVADAKTVGGTINEALVRTIAADSGAALDWLQAHGVQLSPVIYTAYGGMRARCVGPHLGLGGKHYIDQLHRATLEAGIETRFLSAVKRIQRVGDLWQLGTTGRHEPELMARTVILATGGFSGNGQMLERYAGADMAELVDTANPQEIFFDGAQGEGIVIAQTLGARTADMDKCLVLAYWNGRLLDYAGGEMFVNSAGERFVNETASTRHIARAMAEQPQRAMWVITDAKAHKGANVGAKIAMGGIHKSNTIEEMAREMRIVPRVLRRTIERFNAAASAGHDPDFGRTLFTQTIDTPPFYWGKERLSIHMTLGGLVTDTRAQVLDTNNLPIAGLFAAGEVVGGVWGSDRLGGASLAACIVMGRRAGASAAALVDNVVGQRTDFGSVSKIGAPAQNR